MKILIPVFFPILFAFSSASAQELTPDPGNKSLWTVFNGEPKIQGNTVTLHALDGINMYILNDSSYKNMVIDLDMRGHDVMTQSFLGVAFNIRTPDIYELVYFRPFNFRKEERKTHSVQYTFEPAYSWFVLRNNFPDKYENKIEPAPDPEEWFHAKIVIQGNTVKTYVNNSPDPSLVVDRIAITSGGKIGLWVSQGVEGNFKNLRITKTGDPAYGYDSTHGAYFEVAPKTKIYYEVYGEGPPVLLLHGGVYGYIDEYQYFIDELSKHHKVICLATRGHVKSDIGHEPYTYDQRAADAKKLLDHLGIKKTTVIGFSDGGYSAYRFAANYPAITEKMLVIGAGDRPKGTREGTVYSSADLMKNSKSYFEKRVAYMPEPARWEESLQMLNKLYAEGLVSTETFSKINCPVLLLAGEQDQFSNPGSMVKAHDAIKNSSLAIIPGCGHVVFFCNWNAVWACIRPFLEK